MSRALLQTRYESITQRFRSPGNLVAGSLPTQQRGVR